MLDLTRFPISNVAHSADVSRWHSVATVYKQSLAAHSHLVTLYSRYLAAVIAPQMSASELLLLLETAMWHDMPETKTGDMSTPLKRSIERHYPKGESPLDKLEMQLCPPYAELKTAVKGTYIEVIVKLADIMDAIHYIDMAGVGRASKRIYQERHRAFESYVRLGISNWPEYNWLAAEAVLDDLLHGEPDTLDFEELFQEVGQREARSMDQWLKDHNLDSIGFRRKKSGLSRWLARKLRWVF